MTSDLILSCRLILCGIKKIWSHINETESNCIEKKANSDNRVTPTVKKNNFPTSNQRLEEVDISVSKNTIVCPIIFELLKVSVYVFSFPKNYAIFCLNSLN